MSWHKTEPSLQQMLDSLKSMKFEDIRTEQDIAALTLADKYIIRAYWRVLSTTRPEKEINGSN